MTEEITTVKYLIDQLVDVRVACQFWIDKDYESQARIKELEEERETLFVGKSAAKLYQKELVKAEKRIKELEKPSE
tara:strand:+ start:3574 stop:3801 length:228 start_codon:yes stop_codon:yes gene_type:complete